MMKRTVTIAAALLAAATLTATASIARHATPQPFEGAHPDSLRPGPDSARLAKFMDALAKTDPLICELIGDQLGNFWASDGRDGLGRFADAPRALRAAKDSISGHVANPGAIKLLVTGLSSDDACIRRVAAKTLGRSAIPAERLTAMLSDASPRLREAAAYALGEGDRRAARPALEQMLQSRAGSEAAMAAWALGELNDSASVPVLRHAYASSDPHVRLAAIAALAQIGDDRALPDFERALGDDSAPVRYAAAEAFTELHDLEKAPAALVRAAQTGDARLKRLAARALAEIHDPATAEVLIGFLSSEDREVRLDVVQALGQMRIQRAAPALVKALRDADPEVRKAAAEALGELKEGN